MQQTIKLSPRQAEALTLKARGLSAKEAAREMHCSPNNVQRLLEACFFKLLARNTAEAIAKAITSHAIELALLVTLTTSALLPAEDQPFRVRGRGARVVRITRQGRKEDWI